VLNVPYDNSASVVTRSSSVGRFVTKLMPPPIAPSPYRTDAGPFRISMRSRFQVSRGREVMLAGPIVSPSYNSRSCCPVNPRIEKFAGLPGESPNDTPVPPCAASEIVRNPRSCIIV